MLAGTQVFKLFQIPIFVDCSGRRLSGSELPPWSISYPANMNHDHVIVDIDLSGNFSVNKYDFSWQIRVDFKHVPDIYNERQPIFCRQQDDLCRSLSAHAGAVDLLP